MKKKWVYLGIGSVVLLGVGIYFLSNKKSNENDVQPIDNYLHPTFANDKQLITHLAQELHDAMKGYGTDFDRIKATLKDLDQSRFQLVYNRFGKRAYGNYGQPSIGNGRFLNLRQWFKEELSEAEYQELKDKFPKIL
ncbi:hypothetical protein ACIRNY_11350 [Capnocytophaga canimorsus]|uniref:hypothetical protein n=1 Tax=Capnocytophaga canimorsus TaxID=28188 RepID=UPI00384C4C36